MRTDPRRSDDVDFDHCLTPIVPATGAHPMRLLGVSTTRACVRRGRLGLVMGPTLPLPLLASPLLWDGHIASLALESPERIPAGIRLIRAAIAYGFVSVHTTVRAQPLALGATNLPPVQLEDQVLAQHTTKVDRDRIGRDWAKPRSLLTIFFRLSENPDKLSTNRETEGLQAPAALSEPSRIDLRPHDELTRPRDRRMNLDNEIPVERQSAVVPQRIVTRNRRFERQGPFPLKAGQVEGEHSWQS